MIEKEIQIAILNVLRSHELLDDIYSKGIEIYTLEDGTFLFEEAPYDRELKVATYYCGLEIRERTADLQKRIFEFFVKAKTKWQVVANYFDDKGNKVQTNQKGMQELIDKKDEYDIILVNSFGDINWLTNRFFKTKNNIGKGIYSLKDKMFLP